MAKGRQSKGKPADGKPHESAEALPPVPLGPDQKPEYTTFRLYADDGADLSDLAGMSPTENIADIYRRHCAPIIRKILVERTRKKLEDLQKRGE